MSAYGGKHSRPSVTESKEELLGMKRSLEGLKQVRARQICDKETSLISQFFKTFTLDQRIVLKN